MLPRLAVFFLLGLVALPAYARLFKLWTPDDLLPVSSLICNGTVLKLEKLATGKKDITWGNAVKQWKARIKLLSTFKGQAPAEFDLFYTERSSMMDGPMDFTLKEGGRYRFFLNSAPDGNGYNTALEGKPDNVWAVEPLSGDESDKNPPLYQKETKELGYALFHKNRPDLSNPDPKIRLQRMYFGTENDNAWLIRFWLDKEADEQASDPDAEITVLGDRTISSRSWIATGHPVEVSDLKAEDAGKLCLLRVEKQSGATEQDCDVIGTIASVSLSNVVLVKVRDTWNTKQWDKLKIPRRGVRAVQFLVSPLQ